MILFDYSESSFPMVHTEITKCIKMVQQFEIVYIVVNGKKKYYLLTGEEINLKNIDGYETNTIHKVLYK